MSFPRTRFRAAHLPGQADEVLMVFHGCVMVFHGCLIMLYGPVMKHHRAGMMLSGGVMVSNGCLMMLYGAVTKLYGWVMMLYRAFMEHRQRMMDRWTALPVLRPPVLL